MTANYNYTMLRCGSFLLLLVVASARTLFDTNLDEHWANFKDTHSKRYSAIEEMNRRLAWEDNVKYVQKHNLEYDLGKHTYWLGINEYSDLTNEERVAMLNGVRMPKDFNEDEWNNGPDVFETPENFQAPSSVDWRKSGYVTSVKNQGGCGSCWCFSTTGALEGQWKRKHGKLPNLAEQQLVDCDKGRGDAGCDGGWPSRAMSYIQQAGGIEPESAYPYKGRDGSCQFNKQRVVAKDSGSVKVRSGSESSLADAVASVGPVSVSIDASHRSFGHYRGGIYNEPSCSSRSLDHAVLAVGYGPGYWIVKNSWGRSWGNQGYIQMSKDKHNQCGIATSAVYPRV